jgi:transcriptional regulator with XRE-family HTH domain
MMNEIALWSTLRLRTISTETMPNIGKRIRRVRQSGSGRTQAEFASLLGVSRQAVTNWELGKSISRESIVNLSKAAHVSLEWLMNGPDDGPVPFYNGADSLATPHSVASIADNQSLTSEEALSLLTAVFQSILRQDSEEAATEARIVARAVLRAYRTPPAHPEAHLSEDEKRSQVAEAIRLFRSE